MTSDEINRLEDTLTIQLPEGYKSWILQLPPPGQEATKWQRIFGSARRLEELNLELRKNGCFGEERPHHLFAFGDYHDNYFFLDLQEGGSVVYYTDHDAGPYFDPLNLQECFYAAAEDFYTQAAEVTTRQTG